MTKNIAAFLKIPVTLAAILLFSFPACKDTDSSDNTGTFDRREMLRNYANNLIRPAYADLKTSTAALKAASIDFEAKPTTEHLNALKTTWTAAYTIWQSANTYNFGPGGEDGLRKGLIEEIGTFPVNETKIETLIAAGDVSLNNFNRDTRGFLAVEYLVFSDKNRSLLLDAPRRAYLSALVQHLHTQVETINAAWNAYEVVFLAATGTDVGSSTAQLYNEFVRSFEAIKNFKVGLPLGKRAGQTQVEPQLTEAYYSEASLKMLQQHLLVIEYIYYGRNSAGQDGSGLKDYLDKVTGGPELVAATTAQLQKIKDALAAIPSDQPFSVLIKNNHPSVHNLHTELQKQVRFFKSDMSSLLGIAITFSSGDGD